MIIQLAFTTIIVVEISVNQMKEFGDQNL